MEEKRKLMHVSRTQRLPQRVLQNGLLPGRMCRRYASVPISPGDTRSLFVSVQTLKIRLIRYGTRGPVILDFLRCACQPRDPSKP